MVENKISPLRLLKIRALRILLPALLGCYFIVVPQVFYEAVYAHGYRGGFIEFVLAYFSPSTSLLPAMHHSPLGLFTWNHLWYLVYLWHYTLLYLLIRPWLIPLSERVRNAQLSATPFIVALAIIITIIEFFLEPLFPRTHALIDDWYNHARYLMVFFAGYLVAKSPALFNSIIAKRATWLMLGVPMSFLSLIISKGFWLEFSSPIFSVLPVAIMVSSALLWIYALVGYCGAYLNKSSRLLDYMNQAVLPWYILHQTITIVIAMNIKSADLGPALEPLFIVVGTFLGCAILYELIRRFTLLRFMFGLKQPIS